MIQRHHLAQEPRALADHAMVRELLEQQGEHALPSILVEGKILSSGRHPSRQELADWTTRAGDRPAPDPASGEMVALEPRSAGTARLAPAPTTTKPPAGNPAR